MKSDYDERTSKRNRTSEAKAKSFINGISSKRKFLHETKDMLDTFRMFLNEVEKRDDKKEPYRETR